MKILVIQLARLGDIYMTWPALRALRRLNPTAEIHLLTRPRFEGAVTGLVAINKHIVLPVAHILEPMVTNTDNCAESLQRLDLTLEMLRKENYNQVVNLTFSPFSSYLTHYLTKPNTKVLGYTRHEDGYLNFADEVSAFFYAQVGNERCNRVHIADVFASMLGVDFIEDDWQAPTIKTYIKLPENYVVVHIGASEAQKTLGSDKWIRFLTYFTERKPHVPVVLIGADSEQHISHMILANLHAAQLVDLVGKTQIHELFPIIQNAMMLVGCDSAPIHLASLTDTATLNISIGCVNFWETGPKATHGFIYRADSSETLVAQRVAEILALLLEGTVAPELISRTSGLVSYSKTETAAEQFQWKLASALYLGTDFPVSEDILFYEAIIKLEDVNDFILEQLELHRTKGVKVGEYLNRADEIIQSISQLMTDVRPIISWYQAEKIRIAPGASEDVLNATMTVHKALAQILQVYIPQDEKIHIHGAEHGTL